MTNVEVKKVITKVFAYEGREFALVALTNGKYGAVDYKYIENGKTTQALHGGQLYMEDTLEAVIETIKFRVNFENMMASGMTVEQIAKELYGIGK